MSSGSPARGAHRLGDPVSTGRPGRPRRFEDSEELALLLDAAFEVVRRSGQEDVTVSDILAAAGLSTRSFYRHFSSKDELMGALFRRDAEQFADAMRARARSAADPGAALTGWVDEVLAFGLDRPRARRAAVLNSPAVMRSLDVADRRHALALLVAPLAEVIAAGVADGSMATATPEADAALVSTVAWETATRIGEAADPAEKDRLRAHALSFIRRALGVRAD